MKANQKMELEKIQRYHYVLLGFSSFDRVLEKMDDILKFYRFEKEGNFQEKEVIYDVANNLLSDAGIVLSKQYEEDRILFNVRKISQLPGALKRPSQKFILGELEGDEEPKDLSLEISSAIENSFATPFTVDLDSFVKQSTPKIEIKINATRYKLIGGTGFRAFIIHENVVYRDIKSNKKVEREGVTLQLFQKEEYEEENKKILDIIEREVKELGLYNKSRFEIAQNLLYPKEEE